MAPQLSYSIDLPAVSYPGQIADGGFKDVLSALAVASALPYGVLVIVDGANTGGFDALAVTLPSSAGDITTVGSAVGVVLADQARAQDPAFAVATYPQHSAVPCCRKGRVWVLVEEAVNDGDAVYVRYAAGSGTQLGAFRKSADTATAAKLPGAVFRGSVAAPGYALVEFDLA